ncbi:MULTISPECIES: glycosyltransferase [Psychrilyobacter]|uniref:Glycosyltransferase n=1 Tax=Psychrilyobacter piezotolerans TaxID=2293438 RepID=A0ABX9KHR1_9FUSO|nr:MULTISPECIES: glycosyltransferase [Psychrilyobacter]MCS5422315.1 glycosyltransferase [Psychrilyobacter sp. S5]NDI77952.1 glycosyltransferase [Psychrilyobacter piezotolerans]RDE62067.1 glycosyltransferase [Psychrilyobacter sp. S5]REI41314.1 glycosyltransferase [Psychrilyobacter piezotolerans]
MKKKVLIYNGQLFMGGIEKVLTRYLHALSLQEDLEIELLIKENDPEKNVLYKELPKNLKCTFIKSRKMVNFREKMSSKRKNIFYNIIYQIMREIEKIQMKIFLKSFFQKNDDIDVVIDFDMSLGKYLDKIKTSKKIGWFHYSIAAKKGKKRERRRERLKGYDKLVTICDEMTEELREIYPAEIEKVIRLYNPLDIDEVKTTSQDMKNLNNEEKNLIKEKYLIGVSRLVHGKGREDLIKIYAKLKVLGIKEKLYILGEGPEKEKLEKLIEELGLKKEVFLLGQKSNPYVWMRNASLFLHPSYGEGFGLVLAESMVCGTPVIAYDCPTGPKEILEDGKSGGLVNVGDIEKFTELVYETLKNPKSLENYMKNSKNRVLDFSIEKIIKQFIEMLK